MGEICSYPDDVVAPSVPRNFRPLSGRPPWARVAIVENEGRTKPEDKAQGHRHKDNEQHQKPRLKTASITSKASINEKHESQDQAKDQRTPNRAGIRTAQPVPPHGPGGTSGASGCQPGWGFALVSWLLYLLFLIGLHGFIRDVLWIDLRLVPCVLLR